MDNLIFCLNATVPLFVLMILGYIFKKAGVFSEEFTSTMNSFVFKVALPVLVFKDLAAEDFVAVWDLKYVLFCFLVTSVCIAVSFGSTFLFKNGRDFRGELTQASFRSSAALLGIGFIQNIYGNSGMAPLMIIGTVPLYNIMAVVLLSVFKPSDEKGKIDKKLIKKTLIGIVTNPIIIGIVVGFAWSIIKIPQTVILTKTLNYIGGLATPLGLMAMGASFDIKKTGERIVPAIVASTFKLTVWCALFLPVAIRLGYATDKLIAVLVMLGSPTTVSSFIMAKSMGHEGTLSATTVMITSLFSAFTLTFWLFVLKSMGLI